MTLSTPVARKLRHTRRIVCEGFRRDDGLWDIEGRIVDSKPYAYTEPYRGRREPGSEVHDMTVRLTIDATMIVHDIEVSFGAHPYPTCLGAAPAFRGLIGATVGPGWRKAVQAAVGGVKGCTHVRELLFPMATVAFQTLSGWADESEPASKTAADEVPVDAAGKPYFIDGCLAWSSAGEVVARFHPKFYKGPSQ